MHSHSFQLYLFGGVCSLSHGADEKGSLRDRCEKVGPGIEEFREGEAEEEREGEGESSCKQGVEHGALEVVYDAEHE